MLEAVPWLCLWAASVFFAFALGRFSETRKRPMPYYRTGSTTHIDGIAYAQFYDGGWVMLGPPLRGATEGDKPCHAGTI